MNEVYFFRYVRYFFDMCIVFWKSLFSLTVWAIVCPRGISLEKISYTFWKNHKNEKITNLTKIHKIIKLQISLEIGEKLDNL